MGHARRADLKLNLAIEEARHQRSQNLGALNGWECGATQGVRATDRVQSNRGEAKSKNQAGTTQRNRVSQQPPLNIWEEHPGIFICQHIIIKHPLSFS